MVETKFSCITLCYRNHFLLHAPGLYFAITLPVNLPLDRVQVVPSVAAPYRWTMSACQGQPHVPMPHS
ncbi:hypothetical protein SCP_0508250 [Sparassis crispa]|uniref:Uncharacterized protein n=1 Tax=Sparassis crispa TaxID=139825 RepID=A0A401GNN2_9APHY|nr:hypothetical protein SCP_0508250 [Sparassis crispa]GBE83769.1 hypothetical protein SCP_0508250 [Sparassis crispa]